jgi:hypothetical protein
LTLGRSSSQDRRSNLNLELSIWLFKGIFRATKVSLWFKTIRGRN